KNAEPAARIGPELCRLESRVGSERLKFLHGVLIRVLRMDRFAAIEGEAVVADVDRVRLARDDVHLDAAGHRVVEGVVREAARVTPVGGNAERMREVGGNRDDAELRKLAAQAPYGRAQCVRRYVDRHVDRRLERVEQEARLKAFAAAIFEQRAVPAGEAGDLAQMLARDTEFGPGGV